MSHLLSSLFCGGLALVLSACDESSGKVSEVLPQKRFVYQPPAKPVATRVPDGMSQWIDFLAELREEISKLETDVNQASEVHRQNSFDALIQLDPDTLEKDQLCYLWHFADKGYFTVEREIMVRILEDRLQHNSEEAGPVTNIAERASQLAARYEDHLRELHLALDLYAKSQEGKFYVPSTLNDEEIGVLRALVKEKVARAREEISALDLKLDELRRKQT